MGRQAWPSSWASCGAAPAPRPTACAPRWLGCSQRRGRRPRATVRRWRRSWRRQALTWRRGRMRGACAASTWPDGSSSRCAALLGVGAGVRARLGLLWVGSRAGASGSWRRVPGRHASQWRAVGAASLAGMHPSGAAVAAPSAAALRLELVLPTPVSPPPPPPRPARAVERRRWAVRPGGRPGRRAVKPPGQHLWAGAVLPH